MKKLFSKQSFLSTICVTLITVFVIPAGLFIAFSIAPKKAEAQLSSCFKIFGIAFGKQLANEAVAAPTGVPVHDINAIYQKGVNAGQSESSFVKDCIEHGLAKAIARQLIAAMTNSIVTWINGGFNGSPTFIDNPGDFFLQQADMMAGELILGSDLAFLCSPFKLQIQLALAFNYSYSYSQKARCTLSGVFNNVEDAFDNFNEGGWAGWISISQNENNNPYGSYLNAQAHVSAGIAGQRNIELLQANWGNGFLSFQSCTGTRYVLDDTGKPVMGADGKPQAKPIKPYTNYGSANVSVAGETAADGQVQSSTKNTTANGVTYTTPPDECSTQTPGSVIGDQLNQTLGIQQDELGLAKSLDDIFNALANQIFQNVLGGTGLLGMSQQKTNSDGTKSSFLEDLEKQANAAAATASSTAQTNYNNSINLDNDTNQDPTLVTPQNIAYNSIVYQSSFYSQDYSKQTLVDNIKTNSGDENYNGAVTADQSNPSIFIDLSESYPIDRIILYPHTGSAGRFPPSYKIQVWDRNPTQGGTPVYESNLITPSSNTVDIRLPRVANGQFVQVLGSGFGRFEIDELEVYPRVPPAINLTGSANLVVTIGAPYSEPGYKAIDAEGNDIKHLVTSTVTPGPVNTSTAGAVFRITYTVTDSKGASASRVRTVTVQSGGYNP